MNLKAVILIFSCWLAVGCSQGSKTPTNFKLNLGANLSTGDTSFPGGIVLMGNNGKDKFQVGLTPNNLSNFSIELPDGDWSFKAVAWLGEGGLSTAPIMTGPSRCGYTNAKIEGEDTIIKMSLSQAQCLDGVIAGAGAEDTLYGTETAFKKLVINSCLTLTGFTAGDPCNGATLSQMPGESTSIRVRVPSTSTFGTLNSPLVSGCWNNSGYGTGAITQGHIPTQIRLPIGPGTKVPVQIIGFEGKDCQDRNAAYSLPDGLDGNLGLSRIMTTDMSQTHLDIADNFIGHSDSVFALTETSDILPKLACQPDCYPTNSTQPRDPNAPEKDTLKQGIWRYIGNPEGYTLDDIVPTIAATATTGDGLNVMAPLELGSVPNGSALSFINDLSDPIVTSCGSNIVGFNYDNNVHTYGDIAASINGNPCLYQFNATANDPGQMFSFEANIQFMGGAEEVQIQKPEYGAFEKLRRLLIGPIGSALHKSGLTDRAALCDAANFGDYNFVVDSDSVTMRLEAPSASARMPIFQTGYMNTTFERKITIIMSGRPQEAFYFNCLDDTSVGAYFSDEMDDSTHPREFQMFWDTTTSGQEFLEIGVEKYDSSLSLKSNDWFLFKGDDPSGAIYNVWSLRADWDGMEVYHRSGAKVDISTNSTYVQNTTLTDPMDPTTSFLLQTGDKKYELSTDSFVNTVSPLATQELSVQVPNMDVNSNLLNGYSNQNLSGGTLQMWDLSY